MNNCGVFKKMVAIVLLCCIMLPGGCTLITGGLGIYGYLNKDNKTTYKRESDLLFLTALGVSLDYLWYNQAQKYQDQGDSKSSAYAKGGVAVLTVCFFLSAVVYGIITSKGG